MDQILKDKLECVLQFCYLGDTLGAGGGADEAARARGCDVLGLSSRSYRSSWQPVVHHITSRERFLRSVSKVFWHMELRHGQWRLRICRAWEEQSVWWWDGCVVCLWRIGSAVRSFTVFWVFRAWLRWWGMVNWGGLGMWNVRVEMIGCRPVEMWWWQGWDVRVGAGRLGENV